MVAADPQVRGVDQDARPKMERVPSGEPRPERVLVARSARVVLPRGGVQAFSRRRLEVAEVTIRPRSIGGSLDGG